MRTHLAAELLKQTGIQLFRCSISTDIKPQSPHLALMIILHEPGGMLLVADLNEIGSASIGVFIDATGFERPRIVNPAVDLKVLVGVAERQIINIALHLIDLGD